MKYTKTTPCDSCPFRRDIEFHLRPLRVKEIEQHVDGTFACHKTTKAGGADGKNEIHCAGHLILQEKTGYGQMARIAGRLGMFDPDALNMEADVFDTWDEMYRRMLELEGKASGRTRRGS